MQISSFGAHSDATSFATEESVAMRAGPLKASIAEPFGNTKSQ